MTRPFIRYEQDGPIVVLTMDRPDTRNALSGAAESGSFEEACRRIDADESVACAILTGAGTAFCAGGHVKDLLHKKGLAEGSPHAIQNRYRATIQRIPLALYRLQVPLIAAVNGPAYGAGCDIATMCDIRIASTAATFAESFTSLGIVPGDGGAWFLPRVIGRSRAAQMTFTGEPIDAATALQWGLVSSVVEAESLMDESLALARRIAANPASALRMAKRLLREGERCGLESLLEMTAAYQAIAHHTPEHDSAMQRMFSKEKP
jgi:enoyl-CoA hydratase/carnithine racemase